MPSQITGAIWSGAAVLATISIMAPHYANPNLPRIPLALISLLIFILWLGISWILGRFIGWLVLWFKRRLVRQARA